MRRSKRSPSRRKGKQKNRKNRHENFLRKQQERKNVKDFEEE